MPVSVNGHGIVLGFSVFQISYINEPLCSRTFTFRKVEWQRIWGEVADVIIALCLLQLVSECSVTVKEIIQIGSLV